MMTKFFGMIRFEWSHSLRQEIHIIYMIHALEKIYRPSDFASSSVYKVLFILFHMKWTTELGIQYPVIHKM